MSKKVLQDINTRNTDIKEESFKRKWDYGQGGSGIVEREQSDSIDRASGTVYGNRRGGGRKSFKGLPRSVWLGLAIFVAVVLFLVFWSVFTTAHVKIVLSQQTVTINDTFSAARDSAVEGVLSYQVIELQEKAVKNVQPTSEEDVERKASGQIVVYNKHGEKTKLIVNTRFKDPSGKIYRIDKAVVIPGAKGSGDEMIPGSIEVTVYADQPGEEYNVGLVDFTIPGLKDTPLYDDFFARSKTKISGGYKGILRSASEEDVENASRSLREQIRVSLLSKIRSTVDDGRVLYDDAIFIDFTTHIPTEVSESGMLDIEETGFLQAIVFDDKKLSSEIAKKGLSSYDGSVVLVRNLDEVTFAFEDKEEFDLAVNDAFDFVLSGSPHIVWEIDKTAFKNDLAGLPERSKATITENYSSIRKMEVAIKPFWKKSFPDNPDSITVEEVLE